MTIIIVDSQCVLSMVLIVETTYPEELNEVFHIFVIFFKIFLALMFFVFCPMHVPLRKMAIVTHYDFGVFGPSGFGICN